MDLIHLIYDYKFLFLKRMIIPFHFSLYLQRIFFIIQRDIHTVCVVFSLQFMLAFYLPIFLLIFYFRSLHIFRKIPYRFLKCFRFPLPSSHFPSFFLSFLLFFLFSNFIFLCNCLLYFLHSF